MAGQSAEQAGSSGVESSGGEGGGDFDVNDLVRDFESRHGQTTQALQQTQERLQKTDQGLAQTTETLERVRRALVGEDTSGSQQEVDPADNVIAHYEREMENLINTALEAERQKRPIPVTVKLGLTSMQGLIDQARQNKELRQQIAQLTRGVKQATDPEVRINEDAYRVMEGYLRNGLDSVFGVNPEDGQLNALKGAQFSAVSSLITAEIRDLQKNEPETWDRVRRSPGDMKGMVQHFVKQVIPQRARELMYEDNVRRTDLSRGELTQAWRDSQMIKDPSERRAVQERIRPQLLATIMPQRGASRGNQGEGRRRMSINDVF